MDVERIQNNSLKILETVFLCLPSARTSLICQYYTQHFFGERQIHLKKL